MKKFVLVLALALSALAVQAQESVITLSSHNPATGLRTFGTSDALVRNGMTDRHPLKVSIVAYEGAEGWRYDLRVAVTELLSHAVPEGGVLLLRTKSGEVVELANTLDAVSSRDYVGQWIGDTAQKMYYNVGMYPVTRAQLEAIASGVVKLRMQIGGGSFDTEYKKERLGAAVAAHLSALDAAFAGPDDLRSDF